MRTTAIGSRAGGRSYPAPASQASGVSAAAIVAAPLARTANDMIEPRKGCAAAASVRTRTRRVEKTRRRAADRPWRANLLHQVVVPLPPHLDMRGGAELDRFDQIVRDIGVEAWLAERVERRAGRAAADEPGLQILFRRIGELAALPDIIAMAADNMRTAVAIGLAVDEQDRLADP